MPTRERCLEADEAERLVGQTSFAPVSHHHVGIELEWLVVARHQPTRAVALSTVQQVANAVLPLPGGSRITYEPGGQIELSSPSGRLADAVARMEADVGALRRALDAADLALVGLGLDPVRPRRRVVDTPRYAAMEAYFDTVGTVGRTMMCGTAAVQVNLDVGAPDEIETRWRRAHALGPVLVAAFANSPLADGRPSGWRSARSAVWAALDPGRTASVEARGADCSTAWAGYALDARVMFIRVDDHETVPVLEPLTFADWIAEGHPLGWPTADDLAHHLTTLFPPVRPRGWLELRMIDALAEPWWRVAAAVPAALVDDPWAAAAAEEATAAVRDAWPAAARDALTHPALADAARACFDLAIDALPRLGAAGATVDVVRAYAERYVERGRTPADDRLDEWAADGAVLPRELDEAGAR